MTTAQFISEPLDTSKIAKESFSSTAPSNIALVKYWGKKEGQIPTNTSLSFTLKNCVTQTELKCFRKEIKNNTIDFSVFFEGQLNAGFKSKIATFFDRILTYLPFLVDYDFEIHTQNTFPHSSGIASSASGMAALSVCLMQLEKALNPNISKGYFNKKASFIARLGSGSACRSIEGPVVIWGKHPAIKNSSDLYGIKTAFDLHPNFKNYCDSILLVDKGEKTVSSSVGHGLMNSHPFAKERFIQANNHIEDIVAILKKGALKKFITIVESEALTLHAMMMTSNPYFVLMKPNTLKIINKIWAFRKSSNLNMCFSLDAGANVHLLYPQNEKEHTQEFIQKDLLQYCENEQVIHDSLGFGAQ
ncbi:MAG: diphosphomevalonate decarboxylase [Flavobacteriaceae bacterium]|nr:diphosphomevalonate decarboxylase [Flavobacteriaceae bacterium]